jgi:hypothetical protein
MSSATSKIGAVPVQIKDGGAFGWGGVRTTAYIGTKTTKTKNLSGETSYEFEVIQYGDAKGSDPKTIATGYTYKNAARSGEDPQLGGDDFTKVFLQVDPDVQASTPALAREIKRGSVNKLFKQQIKTDPAIKALAQTRQEKDTLDAATGSSDRENPNQTGGDTSTPAPGVSQGIGDNAKTRQNYELNLRYPLTIEPKTQDTLKIDVLKFSPRKIDSTRVSFTTRDGNRTPVGSVILPVNNVADKNSVGWGGEKMDALATGMASLALETIDKGGTGFGEAAKGLMETASNESAGIKRGVAAYFAQQATGTKGLLARTEGAIINPNFELLFNGPKLRSFAFTYRMSARSEPETLQILKIIRMFKQSMAVQRSTSNLFLKSPNTYKLTFRKSTDAEHNFLPKVKECALVSFNINYVPDGTYATYQNSSMVAYELQFQFSELEPIYNDDYTTLDGNSDSQIGF